MAFDKDKLSRMEQETKKLKNNLDIEMTKELSAIEFLDEEIKTQCDLVKSSIESEDFENWLQARCEDMLESGENVCIGLKLVLDDKTDDFIKINFSICTPKEESFRKFELILSNDEIEDLDDALIAQVSLKAILVIPSAIINALNEKFDALGIKHSEAMDVSDPVEKENGEYKMMIKLRFNDEEE